jgi:mono/diheme cytochrome c family protein
MVRRPQNSEDWARVTAFRIVLLAGLVSVLLVRAALAEPAAKENYLQDCAECHGADGKGAQPEKRALRGYISVDLTTISRRNGGEFPRQKVYDAIDGHHRIAAHFQGDMPRWGSRYGAAAGDAEAAQRARERISGLVDFIASIQEK